MNAYNSWWVCVGAACAVVVGCGDDSGTGAASIADVQSEAVGEHCPGGGVSLSLGEDDNADGVLDANEVDSVEYICDATSEGDGAANGDDGNGAGDPAGQTLDLVAVMELVAGDAECPQGGVAILSGADANADGMLGADEVEVTTKLCSEAAQSGNLVATRSLAAGDADCPHGGLSVSQGLDENGDGVLDAGEIDDVSFACNGAPADQAMACAFPAAWQAASAACVTSAGWAGSDLSGKDLSNTYLAGIDFSDSTLNGADLSWTQLRGADFSGADLTGVDLSHALTDDVDFSGAVLDGANLSGVDLRDPSSLEGVTASGLIECPARLPNGWDCADLGAEGLTLLGPGAVLSGLDLTGADLSGFDLGGTQVNDLLGCPAELPVGWQCLDLGPAGLTLVGRGADLSGLDLSAADFSPITNLRDVNFDGANLTNATFAAATQLRDARFVGADLTGVALDGAQLDGVRAFDLVNCPASLPTGWNCLALSATGNTLVGDGADLAGLDLAGANLSGQSLDDANLDQTDLSNADLTGASLDNASLDRANLSGADLDGADLRNADLGDASLAGASLVGARLDDANLRSTTLTGVDLTNASLDNANLDDANLSGATLDGADLSDASIQDANLSNVSLVGADLNGGTDLGGASLAGVTATELQGCTGQLPNGWDCLQDGTGNGTFVLVGPGAALGGIALDLSGADLSGADLVDADLSGADLSGADLSGIDARRVDLSGANLSSADLSGSDFRDADLGAANLNQADLGGTDLRGANLAGVTATDLNNCPSGGELPTDWSCISDNGGRELLIGPDAALGAIGLDLSNGIDLSGNNLAGIDLSGADLAGIDLSGADLSGADLSGADLTDADLTGAELMNADLTGITWSNTICPSGTNSNANGNTCP